MEILDLISDITLLVSLQWVLFEFAGCLESKVILHNLSNLNPSDDAG